jgi:hypothetical protein
MDSGRVRLFLALVPKIPLVARVALVHVLHLSQQSQYWSLRTELVVAVLRSFLTPAQPRSISWTQKLLNREAEVRGRIWIARYTSPVPPEAGVGEAIKAAIDGLRMPQVAAQAQAAETGRSYPELAPVEAE